MNISFKFLKNTPDEASGNAPNTSSNSLYKPSGLLNLYYYAYTNEHTPSGHHR